MNRKIFIAINLTAEVRSAIREAIQTSQSAHGELYKNARLTPEQDWHVTLLFLGEQSEDAVQAIEHVVREVMHTRALPTIEIRRLTTAPPHRPPRMIWATLATEASEQLGSIKKSLVQELTRRGIQPQGEQFAGFNGHITLARLPEGRRIADHAMTFERAIVFRPHTIELMESRLESTGATYDIIRSIAITDNDNSRI